MEIARLIMLKCDINCIHQIKIIVNFKAAFGCGKNA